MTEDQIIQTWFPHRFYLQAGKSLLDLVKTDDLTLSTTPFLDGRQVFWTDPPNTLPLKIADTCMALARPIQPYRIMPHMGFCGSTLLATTLGQACNILALKEPQALVDAADCNVRGELTDQDFAQLLRYLYSVGSPKGAPFIKPSNWVNSLLPRFLAQKMPMRPLFVTIQAQDFVRAVLRGGHERLRFTARLTSHLACVFTAGETLIHMALAASREPLAQAIHLTALAHRMQSALFGVVMTQGNWDGAFAVDFADIQADLGATTRKAAAALLLDIDEEGLEIALSAARTVHSKSGLAYSPSQRTAVDSEVEWHHSAVIKDALDWIATLDSDIFAIKGTSDAVPGALPV